MAVNMVIPLLIPLEENLHNTTRLLPGVGGPVQFSEPRYCLLLAEDAPPSTSVTQVFASHRDGISVRYSITGGNRDGLFTIDQRSGLITLAAHLDFESQPKHELVVAAEAGGQTVHTIVQVTIQDVNDNPPKFVEDNLQVTVVEEDDKNLPSTIIRVVAEDPDKVDKGRLIYSVGGEGVDNFDARKALFKINPHSGELMLLRALNRDPPYGKAKWELRVQVRDGQRVPLSIAEANARRPKMPQDSVATGSDATNAKQDEPYRSPWLKKSFHDGSHQLNSPSLSLDADNLSGFQNDHPMHSQESLSRLANPTLPNRQYFTDDLKPHERLNDSFDSYLQGLSSSEGFGKNTLSHKSRYLNTNMHRKDGFLRKNFHKQKRLKSGNKVKKLNSRKHKNINSENSNRRAKDERINAISNAGREEKSSNIHMSQLSSKPSIESKIKQPSRLLATGWIEENAAKVFPKIESRLNKKKLKKAYRSVKFPWRKKHLHKGTKNQHLLDVNDPMFIDSQYDINETSVSRLNSTNISLRNDKKHLKRHQLSYHKSNSSSNSSISVLDMNTKRIYTGINLIKNPRCSHRNCSAYRSLHSHAQPLLSSIDNTDFRNGRPRKRVRRFVKRFTALRTGGCHDYGDFMFREEEEEEEDVFFGADDDIGEFNDGGVGGRRTHVVETVVTVIVKDINDNPPIFPNSTFYGEVQENGPIDLSVALVSAWDADDPMEGSNANLTYSIEKNVVDERSGQAIFAVNPQTGYVRTAVCCLDRETTPEYQIQVVAVDGGDLKGTATVIVRLADVNDNSPKLSKEIWQADVNETWGPGSPSNATVLEITTLDHDITNYFYYRVIERSGWGWQHFAMRTSGSVGELYAIKNLDYEDPEHRRGFRFMIQVTDRGRGGWSEPRHMDTAWVAVSLIDLNDNAPIFRRPKAQITVKEDTTPGTLLATMPATDPDLGGQQKVRYRVVGGWGALSVDSAGGIRLWRALDRESAGGDIGVARVIAMDEGSPPLSSTATLTVSVTDVNDCAPQLKQPTLMHVTEGIAASRLGLLTATDEDVWSLGHGPPFKMALSPANHLHVLDLLTLKFNSTLDSGRGGGEMWSMKPIDREVYPLLTAEVIVTDAGGLAASHPVTIIIDDVNDNPMKPASKTVYLWKTQSGGAEASLGRVYVEDPDDWDLEDKTFSWASSRSHPHFSLNESTGDIYASTQLREGRYDLQFHVADRVWGQQDVSANVTVNVNTIAPEALAHAVPITLTPTTPSALTAGWAPQQGGGGLGTLIEGLKKVLKKPSGSIEVVSVYGHPTADVSFSDTFPGYASSNMHYQSFSHAINQASSPAFACVWVTVQESKGIFMDPIKLQGLLALHVKYIESVMNLRLFISVLDEEQDDDKVKETPHRIGDVEHPSSTNPASVASLASKSLTLQVIDTNSTSVVTPRLTRSHECHRHSTGEVSFSCSPTSCLNGGRCVQQDQRKRCICPGNSWGPQCKILSRSFFGGGWAWVKPLPPCVPMTLSIRILTTDPNALILYWGPLSSTSSHPRYPPTPMLTMQLVNGQPQVLMEGSRGPMTLQINTNLHDGFWHTLHLHFTSQGASLMVDYCGRGWKADATSDKHCRVQSSWVDPLGKESLGSSNYPLQIGGMAHSPPQASYFGWSASPIHKGLNGCISHLKINGQLVDLGEPAYSSSSISGCSFQEEACLNHLGFCGYRGRCSGGLNKPKCKCDPGWSGLYCDIPTVPMSLGQNSYMKMALSFKPNPYVLTAQLRIRTQNPSSGLLMQLAGHHRAVIMTIELRRGIVCTSISGTTWKTTTEACVEGYLVSDGDWHNIWVERHGINLFIAIDDGDEWRHNETLPSLMPFGQQDKKRSPSTTVAPMALVVDQQDGVSVGGIPEYLGVTIANVNQDISDICMDDIRVAGRPLPVPPAMNGTSWGQVTTVQQIDQGCNGPDLCANTTCLPPLTCQHTWTHATCSCGSGKAFLGGMCKDIDECIYKPCLFGGSCKNLYPGYKCICEPHHSGDNCQWTSLSTSNQFLTPPMVIAALTVSLLLIVVVGVMVTLRIHRWRGSRGGIDQRSNTTPIENVKTNIDGIPCVIQTPISVQDDIKSIANAEEEELLDSLSINKYSQQSSNIIGNQQTENMMLTECIVGDGRQSTKKVSFIVPSKLSQDEEIINGKSLSRQGSLQGTLTSKGRIKTQNPTSFNYEGVATVTDLSNSEPSTPLVAAQDDLRAYAYEGDGSPSGSLTSTMLGLRTESIEGDFQQPLVPECGEVFDLIRKLPDTSSSMQIFEDTSSSSKSDMDNTPLKSISSIVTTCGLTGCTDKNSYVTSNPSSTNSASLHQSCLDTSNIQSTAC